MEVKTSLWQGNVGNDEEYKEAFMIHTKALAETMIGFCMNALTTFSKDKGVPLNTVQMDQVIDFEIQAVIHQVQQPNMIEAIREITKKRFSELQPFQ